MFNVTILLRFCKNVVNFFHEKSLTILLKYIYTYFSHYALVVRIGVGIAKVTGLISIIDSNNQKLSFTAKKFFTKYINVQNRYYYTHKKSNTSSIRLVRGCKAKISIPTFRNVHSYFSNVIMTVFTLEFWKYITVWLYLLLSKEVLIKPHMCVNNNILYLTIFQ